ncbi:hypothetical protein GGH94_000625 [Coemansia aciculifera]|uniref:Uncharacterized protein n=1 Tax=Coemansia aciculifera TaxID=417176 RepID=A0A9W8M8G1_9FUNG|nr:hypothetical protein GGH94_000625 [Coemansia aciculifera]
MNLSRVAAMLFLASHSLAWDLQQKINMYLKIIELAEVKTGSVGEHIIYGKLAQSLGDVRTAENLSYLLVSPQFRDGLLSLITTVNLVRSEAIDDPDGVGNFDYLVGRIRKTYAESLKQFFGH